MAIGRTHSEISTARIISHATFREKPGHPPADVVVTLRKYSATSCNELLWESTSEMLGRCPARAVKTRDRREGLQSSEPIGIGPQHRSQPSEAPPQTSRREKSLWITSSRPMTPPLAPPMPGGAAETACLALFSLVCLNVGPIGRILRRPL